MQTRFATHEYLDAASLCHESCPEMSPAGPSVNPQRVELATAQTARKPIVERSPESGDVRIAKRWKKFIPVTVEQGHVPFHTEAESFVPIVAHRSIAAEKHGEVDLGIAGNPPQ